MSLFDDFLNQCATECINATKLCPRCLENQIGLDGSTCYDCDREIQEQEARNDNGV